MNVITHLDSDAGLGERGYAHARPYRITVNGRELKRCTYVFAVFGLGFAMFHVERNGRLVLNASRDEVVQGVTFGRVRVEPL